MIEKKKKKIQFRQINKQKEKRRISSNDHAKNKKKANFVNWSPIKNHELQQAILVKYREFYRTIVETNSKFPPSIAEKYEFL